MLYWTAYLTVYGSPCNTTHSFILNLLWPSDVKWWHRSGSTLAQVMACYLMAPSHYLNQCWSLISEVLWNSPESNFIVSAQDAILYLKIENYIFKIIATSPSGQWVKLHITCDRADSRLASSQWEMSLADPRFAPSQWGQHYFVTTSLISWA